METERKGNDSEMTNGPNYDVKLGKTLLENWVEQRQCAHIDQEPRDIKDLHVKGHRGILTKEFDTKCEDMTTCRDSFKKHEKSNLRQKGRRLELLEKELYEQISAEVKKEFNPPPPKIDYTSTTKGDFHKDFVPFLPEATMNHDVNAEQPMTYWSHHLNQVHGVSQVRTNDTPFRKNAAFSTPIDEYKDAAKPGEGWDY
eukprot:gene9877-10887_t